MVLKNKHKNINISSRKQINKKSFNAIFFKNLRLRKINIRLLINANGKFNKEISNFLLAWSNIINDKAYINRRRILRRNSCSSCQ